MKAITLLILASLMMVPAMAEPYPDTLWTRIYNYGWLETTASIVETDDSGYLIAGTTGSLVVAPPYSDILLIRTDSQGDTLWTRTYGGLGPDSAYDMQRTDDGGYIIAGSTVAHSLFADDAWLIKINSEGDTLWTRIFRGRESDKARSVRQTNDGGFIVAGSTESFSMDGSNKFYIVRTDAIGDTLWTRSFGPVADTWARSVQETADGGFVVAGYTGDIMLGDVDVYLAKTNSQGDTLWTRRYSTGDPTLVYSLDLASDGGFVIAGRASGTAGMFLMKVDGEGDSLWTRFLGAELYATAYSVCSTDDGGYVLGGTCSSIPGLVNYCLLKTDSEGNEIWRRIYGGLDDDYCLCARVTSDGGYVLAGYSYSIPAWGRDFYVVKTGPDVPPTPPGAFERVIPADSSTAPEARMQFAWTRSFDPNGDPVTYVLNVASPTHPLPVPWSFPTLDTCIFIEIPIPVDPLDQIHEFRWTVHATANGDTVEAMNGMGIFYFDVPDVADEGMNRLPKEFTLNATPNPFNPSTVITYSVPTDRDVSLRVFDLLGREVAMLHEGFAEAGNHRIIFDGSGLASGVYLYRLQAEGFVQARKMVLLK